MGRAGIGHGGGGCLTIQGRDGAAGVAEDRGGGEGGGGGARVY